MSKAPKVRGSVPRELYNEIAAEAASRVVEMWGQYTGRVWVKDVRSGDIRYTEEAQEVFNGEYEEMWDILEGALGKPGK